jgi:hypothetical protein
VADGGGRGGLQLHRGRRNAGQRATAQASIDPREEFRTVGTRWGKTEGKVHWRPTMVGRGGAAVAGARGKGGRP